MLRDGIVHVDARFILGTSTLEWLKGLAATCGPGARCRVKPDNPSSDG